MNKTIFSNIPFRKKNTKNPLFPTKHFAQWAQHNNDLSNSFERPKSKQIVNFLTNGNGYKSLKAKTIHLIDNTATSNRSTRNLVLNFPTATTHPLTFSIIITPSLQPSPNINPTTKRLEKREKSQRGESAGKFESQQ